MAEIAEPTPSYDEAERADHPPVFRVRVSMAERAPRWTGRTTGGTWDYVRYADAAAHFWGAVQLQPDDGWDFLSGTAGARMGRNPYDLERRGRDHTRGGTEWRVSLEVIA